MMGEKKERPKSIISVFTLIWKYEPLYFFVSILKIICNSVSTWLLIWFPKRLIEMLLTDGMVFGPLFQKIIQYTVILFFLWIVTLFLEHGETLLTQRFVLKMKKEIGLVSMKQPYWVIEEGRYREKLHLAGNIVNILKAVDIFREIVGGIVTSAGLAAILVSYHIGIFVLISAVVVIKAVFVKITVNYAVDRRLLYSQNEKVGGYLTATAYMNAGAAKEIRINSLSNWFMGKVKQYRNEMLGFQYKDFKVYGIFDVCSSLVVAIQTIIVLCSLAGNVSKGVISIADFTMYFSAITAISAAMSGIISKLGEYNQCRTGFCDFSELYTTYEKEADQKKGPGSFDKIRFEQVSFQYPGSTEYALKDISFEIDKGDRLSIVGMNGAGKSTIVKLLCKLYKPSSGTIYLNDTDIWEIDTKAYYDMMGAVFQDCENFAFTVRENISPAGSAFSEEKLHGAESVCESVRRLPNGYDTIVSRLFSDDGVDLSGGEQQKIAILRAVYKQAPLIIMDEPTRALDAAAEAEMYGNFFALMNGKTTLFISHRLASSSVANKVLVMSEGKIVERGTHRQLMEKKGLYAEMYLKQSEVYQ